MAGQAADVATQGRYHCSHMGDWGCGTGPDGVCIDSGGSFRRERTLLRVDFEAARIQLAGLRGRIVARPGSAGYFVNWRVGALNSQVLTSRRTDRFLIFSLASPDGSRISDFECRPGS